jgi:hypothetical protein
MHKQRTSVIHAFARRAALFVSPLFLLSLSVGLVPWLAERRASDSHVEVARSYLQATLARDHRAAYHLISSADRNVIDEHAYLEAQVAPAGFARKLAKQLAGGSEIRLVEHEVQNDRARLTLEYKVAAADELSALLLDWEEERLNALSKAEQQRIVSAIAKLQETGNVIMSSGREVMNMIKENGQWKILLDWSSRTPVSFDAAVAAGSGVEVEVLQRKLFAAKDEPFQTGLKLRNRGAREAVAHIEHRIEPQEHAGRIAMIACGFLRPLTLQPGQEREVSSAYLLDDGFPERTPLNITYVFKLQTLPTRAAH